jgi:YtxH-like protein
MVIKDLIDHLPPGEDLVRIARYVGSLRRPARAELLMYGLAGALIGAGIALLFAPARGSELRGRIGDRIDKYMRTAEEFEPNGHDRAEGV